MVKATDECWRPELSNIQGRLWWKATDADICDRPEAVSKDRETLVSPMKQRYRWEGMWEWWKVGKGKGHAARVLSRNVAGETVKQ